MEEKNEYLNLIKKVPKRNIKLGISKKREAWNKQKGECAFCKTRLNPFYCKFVKKSGNFPSKSQEFLVICLNCEDKVKGK